MAGPDWSDAIGSPGTVEVTELVGPEALRQLTAAGTGPVELSATTVAGHTLACSATGWQRFARLDDELVMRLDLQRRPDEVAEGTWAKPLDIRGVPSWVRVRTDPGRGSRLRGSLRFLHVDAGASGWCWRFVGGRAAGEELVLLRGDVPDGEPLVTTFPAAQGRSLGNPKGGATTDRHVTSWAAGAELGEIVLAELLAVARLDALVDYRAARIAEGAQELIGYVPRADANTQ